ncbi:MAG: class II fructose-bisphosphate aldolase [Eubacteriales bacterium]
MLVNLKEILQIADEKECAIGSFNTTTLEMLMAVMQTAEKHNAPVIISHAQVHESVMKLSIIGPIMVEAAKKSKVPVCVHLDHGETLDYLKKALDIGFTSIMYDGSTLGYEDNVSNTIKAVEMAAEYGASVEAEIGVMGAAEGSSEHGEAGNSGMYTDPETAKRFTEATGIDALAASFGTAHGIYKTKPKLDFDRIENIRKITSIPLVMHGGSGVSPEDYKEAIKRGVRKINYYSYMARAGVMGVRELLENKQIDFFHDIACAALEAMADDVEKAIRVFNKE